MSDFLEKLGIVFKWLLAILAVAWIGLIIYSKACFRDDDDKTAIINEVEYELITKEVSAEDYDALVAHDSRLASNEKNTIAYYNVKNLTYDKKGNSKDIHEIPATYNNIPVKTIVLGDASGKKIVIAEGIRSIMFSPGYYGMEKYSEKERQENAIKSIQEVNIPDSVVNLSGLTYTGVQYELENGIYYYKNWAIYTDGVLSGTIEVREGTVGIGSGCFSGSTADNVILPDSLQYISDCAFWNMQNLTEIDLKNTCYVGMSSFAYCTNLTQVSHEEKIEKIDDCAFLNSDIQSLDLSECPADKYALYGVVGVLNHCRNATQSGVWGKRTLDGRSSYRYNDQTNDYLSRDYGYFGKNAFRNSGLQNITLPEGLTKLPEYCFDNSKLTELSIPATLKNIQSRAFRYCKQLTSVTFEGEESELHLDERVFQGCEQLQKVKFEGANITFDDAAFEWCKNLSNIHLPENLTTIPVLAFSGCTALRSIELPEKITTIGESAFMDCTALEIIGLPEDSQTTDENELSEDSSVLDKNVLPANLRTIDKNAFANCTALTTITLPDGLKTLGETAFTKCVALTSIVLPDSVTTMGDGCFKECTALLEAQLGSGIQTLSTECFSGTNLNLFTVEKTVKTICPNALNSNNENFKIEFSNPKNWILTDSADAQTGTKVSETELGDQQKAVTLYRKHCGKYWKKAA